MDKIDFTRDACWWWTGSKTGEGYGQLKLGKTTRVAHRVVYELLVNAVPDGLELDHLCRNRACVNPAHLEPVSHSVNVQRAEKPKSASHCKRGHPFDHENTINRADGRRMCRTCRRASGREHARRKRRKRAADRNTLGLAAAAEGSRSDFTDQEYGEAA